jgi:hypothetical protein
MSAIQGVLLGLMVSLTPSVIFLSCIALQAGAKRYGPTSRVQRPIDRTVALHTP